MSIRSSLLRGKGMFVCHDNKLRFETKTDAVDLPFSRIHRTVVFENRGWILCEDKCHTFKAPASWSCPWKHDVLDGQDHRGGCVTGRVDGFFFVGDAKHGHLSKRWDIACIQRLSRFSSTFDVVWVDIYTPHAFVVTHVSDDKDEVLGSLEDCVEHIFQLGADPYTWGQAVRSAKKECWTLDDWLYVFTDDDDDEDDDVDDDADWEPPSKRRRVDLESESESDSGDEACAI